MIPSKNKLQFTLDDLNSEGDKVIIMVHKSNCLNSQVLNMNFYTWKSLADRMSS